MQFLDSTCICANMYMIWIHRNLVVIIVSYKFGARPRGAAAQMIYFVNKLKEFTSGSSIADLMMEVITA